MADERSVQESLERIERRLDYLEAMERDVVRRTAQGNASELSYSQANSLTEQPQQHQMRTHSAVYGTSRRRDDDV